MAQKITIKDIARHAKVSISTVSRVLNNHNTVTEDKRQAVLAAIEALNYQPNLFAQGLAGGQTRTVGVLTQDISSPIYDAILRGIRQSLADSDYLTIFTDGHWQADKEQEAIQNLLNRQVDGLILIGGSTPEATLLSLSRNIPLVIVGRHLPALENHCVYLDNFAGAYQAVQYLLNCGHKRIAHITGILSQPDAVDRLNGYKQALQDAEIAPDPKLIVEGDFVEASGVMALEMLFARGRPFSAIFAANDQMAMGARLALYRRGIRVPDDVSLIGFDDQHASAYTTPPLTTVRQPSVEMGQAAAEGVMALIKGRPIDPRRFPADLVMRESVARHR